MDLVAGHRKSRRLLAGNQATALVMDQTDKVDRFSPPTGPAAGCETANRPGRSPDGGKGQVGMAAPALEELGLSHLSMLGVAKGEARKPGLEVLIFADGREPVQLPAEHPALHLIQEIRDEAHRFAVSGHRAQRSKTRRVSRLEEIAGIGPKRRKALISHFGGLQGITNAGVDQLTAVPGISRELAETIYSALHCCPSTYRSYWPGCVSSGSR